jgi:hypothetical protein
METPVSNLDFFGVAVRKLLATYHDDEEKLKNFYNDIKRIKGEKFT